MTSVLQVCPEQSFLRCGGLWRERKLSEEEILTVSPPGLYTGAQNFQSFCLAPDTLSNSSACLTLTENEQEKKRGESLWIINDKNMNTLALQRPFMASNF